MKRKLTLGILMTFIYVICLTQNYVVLSRFYLSNSPQNNFENISINSAIENIVADIILPTILNERS